MADLSTLVAQAKLMMPDKFIAQTNDTKIGAFIDLVLQDINAVSPATVYDVAGMPKNWESIVCFGSQVYSTLFLISGYALSDFSYSDNGLSLQISRTTTLSPVYEKMLVNYNSMKINLKKAVAVSTGPKALAQLQFTGVVSNFLASIFPGTLQH